MTLTSRASLTIGSNTYDLVLTESISLEQRTGYIVGGGGSTAWNYVGGLVGDDQSMREGIHVDLGGGATTITIEFNQWTGAQDGSGDSLSWGGYINAEPARQMSVLMHDIETTTIDSENPATLEYLEWSDGGLYEPRDVVLEQPNITNVAEDASWVSGSITCISTADLSEALDISVLNGYG